MAKGSYKRLHTFTTDCNNSLIVKDLVEEFKERTLKSLKIKSYTRRKKNYCKIHSSLGVYRIENVSLGRKFIDSFKQTNDFHVKEKIKCHRNLCLVVPSPKPSCPVILKFK